MRNVEHIGVAVKDFAQANALYFRLLGVEPYKTEFVSSENVNTSFFKVGGTKIELLEGTTEDSAITRFVQRRGEGIHHIAFEVEDILQEMERLKQEGFTLLSDAPKKGADNKLVCFVHPRSANGVLIELTQEIR